MKPDRKYIIILAAIVIIIAGALVFYFIYKPSNNFILYNPGMDKPENLIENKISEQVNIGEGFLKTQEAKSELKGTWQGFRGAGRDNIIQTQPINENWQNKLPGIVWKKNLGEGHAAPAIYEGMVYLLDYDEQNKADVLRCISLTTGTENWKRWYKVKLKRNHGISRTIPAVNQKYIVTMGPRGHIMCLERSSGNLLWTIDTEKEFQSEIPFWYTGQCPIMYADTAIFATAGKSIMIAVDCSTGKKIWEVPNKNNWKMSHSSIMLMKTNDADILVYAAVGGIAGIYANTSKRGSIAWECTGYAPSVVAPSPVIFDKNKILLTAGYGAGSAVIKIDGQTGNLTASLMEKFPPSEGISSEQQTPLFYNGHLYSILPKDAGKLKNQLVCYEGTNCKNPVWSSGKTNKYGLGPYMVINNNILILNDDGELSLIKASDSKFELLSKHKFFDGQDSWGPFAFADGYLILRDSKNMYCLDLR